MNDQAHNVENIKKAYILYTLAWSLFHQDNYSNPISF